jgi:hypothetical protein
VVPVRGHLRGPEPAVTGSRYHRTTVYLTHEQMAWLRQLSGRALMAGTVVSGSDVIRLALDTLRAGATDGDVTKLAEEHAQVEARNYPGRRHRGGVA